MEHLLELYQKIYVLIEEEKRENVEEECRQEFKKLSEGDTENMALWQKFTAFSLANMQQTMDLLNVKPTVAIGESFYEGLPLAKLGEYPDLQYTMKDVINELLSKNIATQNEDGSVGIVFPEETKLPSTILQKRDGTHGYLASDLACVKYRVTNGWNPKSIVYCTDIRQELHFKQVFATAKMAGWMQHGVPHLVHAANGFISLPE